MLSAASQAFLLNRSPYVDDLTTAVFDRIRAERLLLNSRSNTLYSMQRAVAALGFVIHHSGPTAVLNGRWEVRGFGRNGSIGGMQPRP